MAKVNERAEKALKRKAKEANAPYSALKAIYLKGMGAAVTSGRRPGVSPSQWAMARVDSAQWKQIQKHRKKKRGK
jgi:hypothetical protein